MNERTFSWDYVISDKIILTSVDGLHETARPVIPMSYGYGVNTLGSSCRYKRAGSSAKVGDVFLLLLSNRDVLLEMKVTKHEIITLEAIDLSWWATKFMKRSIGEAVSIREIQLPAGTRSGNGNWLTVTSQKKRDPLKPDEFESMLSSDDLREMRSRMVKLLTVMPEEDTPSSWVDQGKTNDLSRIGCDPITKFFKKIAIFAEMEQGDM
jgi:hypothetical protein